MAINPYGLVILNDFGNPKIYSGYARETISGGQFVNLSGTADVVSSGADSFASSDITFFITNASAAYFGGVALKTVTSGEILPVLAEGVYIARAGGNIVAGETLATVNDDDSLQVLGSEAVAGVGAKGGPARNLVGRALCTATSGNFVIAYLRI